MDQKGTLPKRNHRQKIQSLQRERIRDKRRKVTEMKKPRKMVSKTNIPKRRGSLRSPRNLKLSLRNQLPLKPYRSPRKVP
jgi:hypothetical protein